MFVNRMALFTIAAAVAAMVSIAAVGSAGAQERELMDALQTMQRNSKEKKPKTKVKMAPLKVQPMMGDIRPLTGKMRDIGTDRQRVRKRD